MLLDKISMENKLLIINLLGNHLITTKGAKFILGLLIKKIILIKHNFKIICLREAIKKRIYKDIGLKGGQFENLII